MRRSRMAMAVAGAAALSLWGCDENLPVGPASFTGVTLQILSWADTVVLGDSRTVGARASDAEGRQIQGLSFSWTPSDTNVVALATGDTSAGRAPTLVPRRGGVATVRLALPDARFVSTPVTRGVTSVVAGVALATRRDTTLAAVNDTVVNIARALARSGTGTTPRSGQGVEWRRVGPGAVRLVGTGDTVRAIAVGNGVDTLIASHPFCLRGARCADTATVRVAQTLTLAVAPRNIQSWSVADSVAPSVTLSDRRGNGQPGSSIRLVPRTAADSAIVRIGPVTGTFDPATGRMPVPRLITRGNGTARVRVDAIGAAGAVVASDSVTLVVRQVAARVQALPVIAQVTDGDSIPVVGAAFDARNQRIADAVVALTATGITLRGGWFVADASNGLNTGAVVPSLSGAAVPGNNPGAPAITTQVDAAALTELILPSAVAGSDSATVPVTASFVGPSGAREAGRWIRFLPGGGAIIAGATGDSAQTNGAGDATVTWRTPFTTGRSTLTALLSDPTAAVGDSTGRQLVKRSLVVLPGAPSATTSTVVPASSTVVAAGPVNLSVTVRDQYGNVVTTALPTAVGFSAAAGTFGATTCTAGVCTVAYTAPATVGAQLVGASIGTGAVQGSPITLTVIPSATNSTIAVSGALPNVTVSTVRTVTVVLRDATNTAIANATASDFTFALTGGAIGAWSCLGGTCTAPYTAPATPGSATLTAVVNGVAIGGSPINLTIVP